jgi:hypothetical protein
LLAHFPAVRALVLTYLPTRARSHDRIERDIGRLLPPEPAPEHGWDRYALSENLRCVLMAVLCSLTREGLVEVVWVKRPIYSKYTNREGKRTVTGTNLSLCWRRR